MPTPSLLFQEGAVLQRDRAVPVWGHADPGERVTVTFRNQQKQCIADTNGRWQVTLDPMPASTEPAVMRISGSKTAQTLNIGGMLVGDVWLCSGQSNMWWTMRMAGAAAEAAKQSHPLIRQFRANERVAHEPADRLTSGEWWVATPPADHIAGRTWAFTATGYYFARKIHAELGVPVGLINASVPGTTIESWMSESALRQTQSWGRIDRWWKQTMEAYPASRERYEKELAEFNTAVARAREEGTDPPRNGPRPPVGPDSRQRPNGFYNGMIHPVMPYAVRGILWYQGESNVGHHDDYAEQFPIMIAQWRNDLNQGDLPFYFVQLPNFAPNEPTGQRWALFREAQAAALALPTTGMAVTIDIGDPVDIHPSNKRDVGLRLALVALAKTYGRDLPYSGPVYREASVSNHAIVVTFKHALGLVLRQADASGFESAGEDMVFHPAQARIEHDAVHVTSPHVIEPVAVRYAWHNNPPATLFNAAGLPAAPFRSDAPLPQQ